MNLKIRNIVLLLPILCIAIFSFAGCSGSNLDGHYVGVLNDEAITVDVEGDNVVIPYDYGFSIGTIDSEKKVFNLSNKKNGSDPTDVYQYDIVNGKLVLTIWGETVTLTKDNESHKITSLDGSYYFQNPEYYFFLDIKGNDVMLTDQGVGFKYTLKDNILTDTKRDDSYNINTVYSAFIISDDEYYKYCFFKDDKVSELSDLTGKYIQNTEYTEDADKLEIDEGNKKAIITLYGEDYLGTIDTTNKRVNFDSLKWDCPYEIYNNKIAIGDSTWASYYVFELVKDSKKEE